MITFKRLKLIKEMATRPGYDFTTLCLLGYSYFKEYYKVVAINLIKQHTLDEDPKVIKQINFTGNLAQDANANTTMIFIIGKVKETALLLIQKDTI